MITASYQFRSIVWVDGNTINFSGSVLVTGYIATQGYAKMSASSEIIIIIIIIALRHVYRFTVYIGSNSYSSYKV